MVKNELLMLKREENIMDLKNILVKVDKALFSTKDDGFFSDCLDEISVQECAIRVIRHLSSEIKRANELGNRELKIQNYSTWIWELSYIALHDMESL